MSPPTIRSVLLRVNNPETPIGFRREFRQLCPIPGVCWNAEMRITNVDDVWPADYGPDLLRADVHAYTNLLTRVSGRLPKSFITNVPSGGNAAKSGSNIDVPL